MHIRWNSFLEGYSKCIFDGESILTPSHNQPSFLEYISDFGSHNPQKNPIREDYMRGLLRDALALGVGNLGDSSGG